MIKFDKLEISKDGNFLTIEVSIENTTGTVYQGQELDYDWYRDVYLDQIIIDTDKSYSDLGPSGKVAILNLSSESALNPETGQIETQDTYHKSYKYVLDIEGMGNRLFFIYVTTKGEPAVTAPCGLKNPRTATGVAYNKYLLYKLSMNHLKSVGNSQCDYDKWFYDFLLRFYAFKLSIKSGKFNWAIVYWNKFFMKDTQLETAKPCGCHG